VLLLARSSLLTQPLTFDEFAQLIGNEDPLSFVIRGHQATEAALVCLIATALPNPHQMELAKLSFQLKVDLAVALQLIRSESRPLFFAVNTVRNRFAHRSGYESMNKVGLI
jgi:hypothetical protein